MSDCNYQVWILNSSMQRLAILDEYTSLTWTRRWQQPNTFEIHCSRHARGAEYLVEDNLLQVVRDGEIEFTAIIEHGELALDESGKASEVWTCRGGDVLTRRLCVPPAGYSHDERSGAAETVMKGFVDANCISPADTNRTISLVSNEADGGRGASVSMSARYEALADKLEEAARAGGIGWELVGTATGLEFRIVPGVDRSAAQSTNPPIIFSPDFGNLRTLGYQWSMLNRATLAYVAGQGEGAARQIQVVYDGVSVPTGTARREQFIDARDLDSTDKLIDRGHAKLDEQGPRDRLEAQILTGGPFQYRTDWDLGDVVTVRNMEWGVLAHLRITEVRVTLEPESGEQIEVAFGAPPANLLTVVAQAVDSAGVAVRADAGGVADGSVTTAKLADGAATGSKLGSDVVRNAGSQSIDSPTFVVDATNHRVGIGTASPEDKLHVAGQVSITGASRVRAYRTGTSQSIPHNTATKIQLNAVVYDNLSEFDSTTNYRFTAIRPGYYIVSAGIRFGAVDTNVYFETRICKNGNPVAVGTGRSSYSGGWISGAATVTDIIYLQSSDYIELWAFHWSPTNSAETADPDIEKTFLAIHRIS